MKLTKFIGQKAEYDTPYIWGVNSKDELQIIAEVRGWGAIQNLFKRKDGSIDDEKAAQFQDQLGQFIADAITEKLTPKNVKMKTKKEWENSNLDLDEYLNEPCEIDEELDLYIGECVSPKYNSPLFTQCGEPRYYEDGIGYFMTVSIVNGKHFYLGILPEFKD